MITQGRVMVSAEVTPEMKDRIESLARSQGVSQSKVLRDILTLAFSINESVKARKGNEKSGEIA